MNEDQKIWILVLDRGFVGVCRCVDPTLSGFWIKVQDYRGITNWGTTKGLGELVKGPTPNTTLDAREPHEAPIPTRAIIRTILVDQNTWEPYLNGTLDQYQEGSRPRTTQRKQA
jgi:hypothetical protein